MHVCKGQDTFEARLQHVTDFFAPLFGLLCVVLLVA